MTRITIAAAAAIAVSLAAVIAAENRASADQDRASQVARVADLPALKRKFVRPTGIPHPKDNPYSDEKRRLGKMLFFDPRLSRSKTVSCGTCHNPSFSWGDGLALAVGFQMKTLGRRTPTVLNLAWSDALFWDGRAASLEEQALGPIKAPGEMNLPIDELLKRLRAIPGYRKAFARAFPDAGLSAKTVAKAIATFERTIVSGLAPFDLWIQGDESAVSESAKRGFVLFAGKAGCTACHSGWNFTDDSFHDIGLKVDDPGRGRFLPKVTKMRHAFKTPGLRNIAHRGPYMHNGTVPDLKAVIRHYNDGFISRPSLSDDVKRLKLNDTEIADLAEFMKTLSSDDPPTTFPTLPR